ncbi:MAG: hypothetical protein ACREWJ_01875 [Rhodoferax sp.]
MLQAGSAQAGACAMPKNAVVTQRSQLRLGTQTVIVAALSLAGTPNNNRSRLLVLDTRCRPLWSQIVDGLESRFDIRLLGQTQVLQFVTMQVFGDGTRYVHRLLKLRANRLKEILPPISHTGKDGFYLGPLVHGRGEGLVTWTADPSGEAEADPHPYVIRQWLWRSGQLLGPKTRETTQKYLPSEVVIPRADVVAQAMRLPYRDQTGTQLFMAPERVLELQDRLRRGF